MNSRDPFEHGPLKFVFDHFGWFWLAGVIVSLSVTALLAWAVVRIVLATT